MESSAAKNREKAAQMVKDAASRGAEIICLPELFTSPYFCNIEDAGFGYAEELPADIEKSATGKALSEMAREAKAVLVGGSVHEKAANGYYNTSCVFDAEGKLLGRYRKTHIPHDPGFFEQHYFSPGDTGFQVFDTPKAEISALICYDQWYPEAARSVALLGADIVFYPTAIGNVKGMPQREGNWQEAWENVQRGHAIANCMIVAAVNRVGTEGDSEFWGGSFVCDAFGKTLVRGGRNEEVIICEVDLDHSTLVKEGWRFFYNRRPEAYRGLSS
jgi:agmatine deiminase